MADNKFGMVGELVLKGFEKAKPQFEALKKQGDQLNKTSVPVVQFNKHTKELAGHLEKGHKGLALFERELKATQALIGRFSPEVAEAAGAMGEFSTGAGSMVGAMTALGAASVVTAKELGEFSSEVQKMKYAAARSGMAPADLRVWELTMGRFGLKVEEADASAINFTRNMLQASRYVGTVRSEIQKTSQQALLKLNQTFELYSRGSLSFEDATQRVLDNLDELDEAAKKSGVKHGPGSPEAITLIKEEIGKLLGLSHQLVIEGGKGYRKNREEVQKLFDKKIYEGAEEGLKAYREEWNRTLVQIENTKNYFTKELTPIMTKVVGDFNAWATGPAGEAFFKQLAGDVGELAKGLAAVVGELTKIKGLAAWLDAAAQKVAKAGKDTGDFLGTSQIAGGFELAGAEARKHLTTADIAKRMQGAPHGVPEGHGAPREQRSPSLLPDYSVEQLRKLKGFQHGGPVEETGPAWLHEGEHVLTRGQVQQSSVGGFTDEKQKQVWDRYWKNFAEVGKNLLDVGSLRLGFGGGGGGGGGIAAAVAGAVSGGGGGGIGGILQSALGGAGGPIAGLLGGRGGLGSILGMLGGGGGGPLGMFRGLLSGDVGGLSGILGMLGGGGGGPLGMLQGMLGGGGGGLGGILGMLGGGGGGGLGGLFGGGGGGGLGGMLGGLLGGGGGGLGGMLGGRGGGLGRILGGGGGLGRILGGGGGGPPRGRAPTARTTDPNAPTVQTKTTPTPSQGKGPGGGFTPTSDTAAKSFADVLKGKEDQQASGPIDRSMWADIANDPEKVRRLASMTKGEVGLWSNTRTQQAIVEQAFNRWTLRNKSFGSDLYAGKGGYYAHNTFQPVNEKEVAQFKERILGPVLAGSDAAMGTSGNASNEPGNMVAAHDFHKPWGKGAFWMDLKTGAKTDLPDTYMGGKAEAMYYEAGPASKLPRKDVPGAVPPIAGLHVPHSAYKPGQIAGAPAAASAAATPKINAAGMPGAAGGPSGPAAPHHAATVLGGSPPSAAGVAGAAGGPSGPAAQKPGPAPEVGKAKIVSKPYQFGGPVREPVKGVGEKSGASYQVGEKSRVAPPSGGGGGPMANIPKGAAALPTSPRMRAFVGGIGAAETGFSTKEATSLQYNTPATNPNVKAGGGYQADYGFMQMNPANASEAVKKYGMEPEQARFLYGNWLGGASRAQQEGAVGQYIGRRWPKESAELEKTGDFEKMRNAPGMRGMWSSLKPPPLGHPQVAKAEFDRVLKESAMTGGGGSAGGGGATGSTDVRKSFGNEADRFAIDQARSKLNEAMTGEVSQKIEGTGQLDVNVRAPPGTATRSKGGGLFQKINMNRAQNNAPAAGGPPEVPF